jgi:hypothetical protein
MCFSCGHPISEKDDYLGEEGDFMAVKNVVGEIDVLEKTEGEPGHMTVRCHLCKNYLGYLEFNLVPPKR